MDWEKGRANNEFEKLTQTLNSDTRTRRSVALVLPYLLSRILPRMKNSKDFLFKSCYRKAIKNAGMDE